MWKRALCEAFGTFSLVFVGTGAIIVNDFSSGSVTHVGIALTFGLMVLAMVYSIGEISGAHLNPAVTIGFVLGKRFPLSSALQYLLSQMAGALAASFSLRMLFPSHATLGATLPVGTARQSFIFEIILTLILMFVILRVSTEAREQGIVAGIAVGSVVALEALFAGPISGASMNPARSLGPAIVSMHLEYVWIYTIAPVIGASLGVLLSRLVGDRK